VGRFHGLVLDRGRGLIRVVRGGEGGGDDSRQSFTTKGGEKGGDRVGCRTTRIVGHPTIGGPGFKTKTMAESTKKGEKQI